MALGRPKTFRDGDFETLREVLRAHPSATLAELCKLWEAHTGRSISEPTIRKVLNEAGIVRVKIPVARLYKPDPDKPKRYGYKPAHRRSGPERLSMSDAEWALAQDLFVLPAGQRGRPPIYERRQMVDACLYVLRTGCAWRMLPPIIFPPWQAVHKTFMRWVEAGKFEQLQDRLRRQWRERMGQQEHSDTTIIDSQSTRSSPQGGEHGYDAGKKVKGRKRHIVVDTMGLIVAVVVTAASVQDRDAAAKVLTQAQSRTGQAITTLYADAAYAGKIINQVWLEHGIQIKVVRRGRNWHWRDGQGLLWPELKTMPVLPRRWIVERSHAWLEKHRRLTMHHDRKVKTAQGWVWLAQVRMLLTRLTAMS
jgi:putative transposase